MQKKVIKVEFKQWTEVLKESENWGGQVIDVFSKIISGNEKMFDAIVLSNKLTDTKTLMQEFVMIEEKFKELGWPAPQRFVDAKNKLAKNSTALKGLIEQISKKHYEINSLTAKIDSLF